MVVVALEGGNCLCNQLGKWIAPTSKALVLLYQEDDIVPTSVNYADIWYGRPILPTDENMAMAWVFPGVFKS